MIQTGEYNKDTQISLSNIKETTKREVGDIWEEDGVVWEQKSYGKVKQSKLSNELSKIRKYLEEKSKCQSADCETKKYSNADKKLIKKAGFCAVCLAKKETKIKVDGLWKEYEDYKTYSNMAAYGTEVLQKWNQALDEVTNIHKYVNDDGSIEKWSSNEDVQTLKSQIEKDIIELDRRVNLLYSALEGKIMRIFPVPNDDNNKWISYPRNFFIFVINESIIVMIKRTDSTIINRVG